MKNKNIILSLALISAFNTAFAEDMREVDIGESVVNEVLMRSSLDELNRNVYTIDRDFITDKGFRDSESIFRYTPFISLSNTGLGANLDLRGQGNKANTNVQVLINGVYSNMLDSSHGVTPLNTLSPSSIEAIEILPGGGAVRYGNGTRGGVVNILTRKRFDKLFYSIGANYSLFSSTTGSNYNVDAKYGDKFGDFHLNVGAAYINKQGPRKYDHIVGGQANLGLLYDLTPGSALVFDADFYRGGIRISPNNSFMVDMNPANDKVSVSKDDRIKQGNGSLYNEQTRFTTSFGYEGNVSDFLKMDAKIFYHYNRIDYKDSVTILSRYSGMSNVSADQSGSFFDDQKAGLYMNLDLKHDNGRFLLGFESLYQMSKRTMNQHILASATTGTIRLYDHTMYIPFEGNKWTNALYAIEKYDFTDRFSLTGGARYDYSIYDVDANYDSRIRMDMVMLPTGNNIISRIINATAQKNNYKKYFHNFALELTPSYRYSNDGVLYAKYERGFFSPSPNSMLQRDGSDYLTTDLKKETYDTFEVGLKDYFFDSVTFSSSIFYTQTNNEFYTIGNAHKPGGVEWDSYDKTTRIGFEVASEQFFGIVTLNESLSVVDARVIDEDQKGRIPNVYNYKATIGASVEVVNDVNLYLQNAFLGKQKVIGQEESLKPYSLTDIGVNAKFGNFSLGLGVRNLFDTFYYDYYNADANDTIAGYAYLTGAGRTFFLEGRYEF